MALQAYPAEQAKAIFAEFRRAVVDVDDDTLQEAVALQVERKRQDLSYADCIGYVYVRRHGLRFLTGDRAFEGLDGVEFVK